MKYILVDLSTDKDRGEFETEEAAVKAAWDAWGENISTPWGVLAKDDDDTGEWVVLVFGDEEWRPS